MESRRFTQVDQQGLVGVHGEVEPWAQVPGRSVETHSDGDFRLAQTRTPRFDATTAGNLAAKLFQGQSWLSLGCGMVLLMGARDSDRTATMGWAGGYVGDGVSTTNLAGRTLADVRAVVLSSDIPKIFCGMFLFIHCICGYAEGNRYIEGFLLSVHGNLKDLVT